MKCTVEGEAKTPEERYRQAFWKGQLGGMEEMADAVLRLGITEPPPVDNPANKANMETPSRAAGQE